MKQGFLEYIYTKDGATLMITGADTFICLRISYLKPSRNGCSIGTVMLTWQATKMKLLFSHFGNAWKDTFLWNT
jgi:hypothetical protein